MAPQPYTTIQAVAYLRRTRMGDPSSAPATAARGLLALAMVESRIRGNAQFVRILDVTRDRPFLGYSQLRINGTLSVMFNDLAHHRIGPQPWHTDTYGPRGHLRLRAITLSHDKETDMAVLGLILPIRTHEPDVRQSRLDSGFTVVMINSVGMTDAITVIPDAQDPLLLPKLLGLTIEAPPDVRYSSRGSIDDTTGLINLDGYLADELPKLEEYLSTTASHLGGHPANRH